MVAAHVYEIRVAGTIPPEALPDCDHWRAALEPAKTVIHSRPPDQAALSGLLARLEMHGIELLAIRRFRGAPGAPIEAAEKFARPDNTRRSGPVPVASPDEKPRASHRGDTP